MRERRQQNHRLAPRSAENRPAAAFQPRMRAQRAIGRSCYAETELRPQSKSAEQELRREGLREAAGSRNATAYRLHGPDDRGRAHAWMRDLYFSHRSNATDAPDDEPRGEHPESDSHRDDERKRGGREQVLTGREAE